jgi:uncharacterized protein (DUF433 family)
MTRDYVEKREGGYYISGSRVALECVVGEFLEGASPEAIRDDFPTLSLEEVYGAITFYLANRAEIDAYLAATDKLWQESRTNQPPLPQGLRERLERARRGILSRRE